MRITISTPTYNRGYIIGILYNSLKNQTFKNFEWLIIDDGSNDSTEEIVKKMILEEKINIKYFKQKNLGKHIAVNKAIEESEGELFFIVDSDDFLPSYSLETIDKWFRILEAEKTNKKFIGISGAKMYLSGKIVGNIYEKELVDTDYLTYRKKLKILGDKAEVFYTNILKNYRFPKYENENFLTEAVLWNKIAKDGYILRWYNEPIYICEYLEDGLSKKGSNKYKENWRGAKHFLFQEMSKNYKSDLKKRIISIGFFIKLGLSNNYSLNELRKEIKSNLKINEIELLTGCLIGVLVHYKSKIMR